MLNCKKGLNDSNLFSCSVLPAARSPWIAVNGSHERRADETGTHNPRKSHWAPFLTLLESSGAFDRNDPQTPEQTAAERLATSTSLSVYTDNPFDKHWLTASKTLSPTHRENPEWSPLWRASYSSPAPCLSCSSKVIKEDVWRHNTDWVVIKKSRGSGTLRRLHKSGWVLCYIIHHVVQNTHTCWVEGIGCKWHVFSQKRPNKSFMETHLPWRE